MITKVLLVDDHKVFRMGLNLLLAEEVDMEVIGEAGDGQTAIAQVKALSPDVVVMDIAMPDMDGIEATGKIKSEFPEIQIICLSIHAEKDFVESMLQAGATGYVLKERALEDLVPGVRAVASGEIYLSASIKDVVIAQYMDTVTDPRVDLDTNGGVLTTKLYRPALTTDLVSREHLLAHLNRHQERPLTLISAPAGYGKTTLISSWLETVDSPAGWYQLDENDNNLISFLTHFLASVQIFFPQIGQKLTPLIVSPNPVPLAELVASVSEELDQAPSSFLMVLDDYHLIHEPRIHDFLSELLRHPPQRLHLVISTRQDPPLPITKLRAQSQVTEIRQQDLQFNSAETAVYLQKITRKTIDSSTADSATEKTEGWVTGLRLLALSLRHRGSDDHIMADLPDNIQYVTDYLVSEVLENLLPEVQEFLLKTSILNRLSVSLCRALFDSNIKDILSRLHQENLFIIPLDHQGEWFRYHHLFQELLQNRLRSSYDLADIVGLHSRASDWFAENNFLEEAIDHAMAAGDVIRAAEIIEQNRYALMKEETWYVLSNWLEKLPNEFIEGRPDLLIAQAQIYLSQNNINAIFTNVEKAEKLIGQNESNLPIWGEIYYLKGYFCYFQGLGSQAHTHQVKAVELVPESNLYVYAESKLHFALTLHMTGKKERAIHKLNHWIHSNHDLNGLQSSRLWAGLCFIYLLEGELRNALYPTQQCMMIAQQIRTTFLEGWFLYLQACMHFLQNDLEKAIQELTWVAEKRRIMQLRIALDSLCGLAIIYQIKNQPEKAKSIIEQMQEFIQQTNDPMNNVIIASCRARLSLIQGDIPSAVHWLQTSDISVDVGIMLWWLEIPRITECRVLIAEGSKTSLNKAVAKLRQLEEENKAVHNVYQQISILALLALAYKKQDLTEDALTVLEQVLSFAILGTWIQPFIELGTPMADLLNLLKKQRDVSELETHINLILSAYPSVKPKLLPILQPQSELNSLTKRELQILKLLTTKLTTREISEELSISFATLRTHIKNIYSKLDAHSRIEAVQNAQDLKLI